SITISYSLTLPLFFKHPSITAIYTLSLHDALPISLLSQATALTNAVVYPISLELTRAARLDGHLAAHRSWLPGARMPLALPAALPFAGPLPGLAQHARAVGHTLAAVDPDGVVRRVPVFVRLDDAAVPSFGLALAMAFMDVRPDQVVVA